MSNVQFPTDEEMMKSVDAATADGFTYNTKGAVVHNGAWCIDRAGFWTEDKAVAATITHNARKAAGKLMAFESQAPDTPVEIAHNGETITIERRDYTIAEDGTYTYTVWGTSEIERFERR